MRRNPLPLVNFFTVDVDSFSEHTFVASCENESDDVTDADGLTAIVYEEDAASRTRGVGQHRNKERTGVTTSPSLPESTDRRPPVTVAM